MASTVAILAQQPIECNHVPVPPCPEGGVTGRISGGILPAPGQFTLRTAGPSIFMVTEGEACCYSLMRPDSWVGEGSDVEGMLGRVVWSFPPHDQTFDTPPSSVRPLGALCLPAEINLYFWIEGTIDALPGMYFRSLNWIHVQNPNATTCLPFVCEIFTLQNGRIPFTDVNGPAGNIAFWLDDLTVVLNP